ncbi:MAG: TPM domain-containing protein [Burkholderiales bacterium]
MTATAVAPGSIAERVAAIERARGVEVVTASIGKADTYPEIPWRACALVASLAALAVAAADLLRPDWVTSTTLLVSLAFVLLSGAAAALLAIYLPPFARRFLDPLRAEVETRQYARTFFLERQLFRTRRRNGILILVARFEHRVELVADIGFDGRVGSHEWQTVIPPMIGPLSEGRVDEAFAAGLAALDALLASRGFAGGAGGSNELPDATIDEAGEDA